MIHITATAQIGSSITHCIEQTIRLAGLVYLNPNHELPDELILRTELRDLYDITLTGEYDEGGVDVTYEFNYVKVTVKADSNPELIHRDWHRAMNGYIDRAVGPYPNPVLTDEEKQSDAHIEAENEQKRQELRDEANAKHAAAVSNLEETLKDAPAIELSDKDSWQESARINSGDPYSNGVTVFAERWARIMQVKLAKEEKLEDIADPSVREADVDGITGFMYGCAVNLLAQTWKHGDELRKWHNKKYGVSGDVEGTVNPAVITINV